MDGEHGRNPHAPRHEYPVEHSARELERLRRQAALIDPLTRAFLQDAGLGPGMRVLDVGSGAGDVSLLAAELVGPTGFVVGADRSPRAVAQARARVDERGVPNVAFVEGDPTALPFEDRFDAVIGRLVLMYYPDPAEALRRLAARLRPGGLLAFQEADYHGRWSVPPAPTYDRCMGWITSVLAAVGAHTDLGFGLHRTFVEAGLDPPCLSCCACVGGGERFDGYGVIAEIVRGMLPNLERFGLATREEIGIDSLERRLRDEVVPRRSTVILATLVGAWTRTPGGA